MTEQRSGQVTRYKEVVEHLRKLARDEYGEHISTESMLWEDGSFYVTVFHSWDESIHGDEDHTTPVLPREAVERVWRDKWCYDSEEGYWFERIYGPEGLETTTLECTEKLEGPA
jgi:hypothetical protein